MLTRKRLRAAFIALLAVLNFGIANSVEAQQTSQRQVRNVIRDLNSAIDDFQYRFKSVSRSGAVDSTFEAALSQAVGDLRVKVQAFEENLLQRRENRDDANAVAGASAAVENLLRQNRAGRMLESDWRAVSDLAAKLGDNYAGASAPRETDAADNGDAAGDQLPPTRPPTRISTYRAADNSLSGTYKLDTGRSENVAGAIAGVNVADAARRSDLEGRLEAPEQIAIDVSGQTVTLASSKAAPVTFTADGRDKTEVSGGQTVRLRATLRGEDVIVSSVGGETDYTVSFSPVGGGRGLKVTRRITTDYLPETLIVESFYNKTDAVARLGIDSQTTSLPDDGNYSSNDPADRPGAVGPSLGRAPIGEYIVPDGMFVTAVLDSSIDTKVTQNNDRFKMIVQSPGEFRGAVVEGYLSGVGRSGQVSGRSNVTFNFERITLRNGRTYDFSGVLLSVKDQSGKVVKVDAEGTAKGESQTKETAKRGGLGAGLGAIIGAIAGGGQGAAIGAIIGGGVGAGSVIIQGRDDIQLLKGSTITVQSASPVRRVNPER